MKQFIEVEAQGTEEKVHISIDGIKMFQEQGDAIFIKHTEGNFYIFYTEAKERFLKNIAVIS